MSNSAQPNTYVLGNDPAELARLDRQAAAIERATRLILGATGIRPGSRVLDLGTGLGHVARLAAELVGTQGSVVGIDRSRDTLAIARQRVAEAGLSHISFVEGDVTRWRAPQPFDAIVGRLVLFHLADQSEVVRHHLQNLRSGGLFVAIDFDIGSSRTEPPVALATDCLRWVCEAFASAGASPHIGARLGLILERAGLTNVTTFGIQPYLGPRDPAAPALLSGVVRSLAATMIERGIVSADVLRLDTLESRLADEIQRADAVLLPPTVVGAWGQTADAQA